MIVIERDMIMTERDMIDKITREHGNIDKDRDDC